MSMKYANIITLVATIILAILIVIWLTGCTCYMSVGREIGADEIIVRKYNSKVDLTPELLDALKLMLIREGVYQIDDEEQTRNQPR